MPSSYKKIIQNGIFFLDERGGRNCPKTFTDDEFAYDYLWKQLLIENKYPSSTHPSTLGI